VETNHNCWMRFGISEVSRIGEVVEISCSEVIRELSNYIDKDMTPHLREQIVAHLPGCSQCTAIYDGLRNTITLTGDGRSFDLPVGFSQRLRAKLTDQLCVRLHLSVLYILLGRESGPLHRVSVRLRFQLIWVSATTFFFYAFRLHSAEKRAGYIGSIIFF